MTSDFRSFLQAELVRRTKANPRFSLRAFARVLGVQSGFLSKLLLGQRRVTPATVRRFGGKLGLTLREIEAFERTCASESADEDLDFRQIAYDHFQTVADWYHFAILELARIEGFQPTVKGISRSLGISQAEARSAIERLQRLKYISIAESGEWTVEESHTTTLGSEETAAALRLMQRQILEKAIVALEEVAISRRDQSTMTMAADSSRLPEAKERIKKFRRQLCAFLEGGEKLDSVYMLSMSLFPVTWRD